MRNIYPYPTLPDEVQLNVTSAVFDTGASNSIDQSAKVINLADRSLQYELLELDVAVTAPPAELSAIEQESEVSAVVVLRCRSSNLRQVFELTRDTTQVARWTGKVYVYQKLFFSTAEIVGLLSADRIVSAANNDERQHSFIGASSAWRIASEISPAAPIGNGGSFPVKWVSFNGVDLLKDHKSLPFYVMLNSDPPEVWLNRDFEGLSAIFPQRGKPSGALLPIHEVERTNIARTAWLSMFQTSMSAIESADTNEPLWPTETWKRDVLLAVLPKMYQGESDDEALRLAFKECRDDAPAFQSKLVVAASRLVQEDKALQRALYNVNKLGVDQVG